MGSPIRLLKSLVVILGFLPFSILAQGIEKSVSFKGFRPEQMPAITAITQSDNWQLSQQHFLNFEYSNVGIWLKVDIHRAQYPIVIEIPTAWLDKVSFYWLKNNEWQQLTMGDSIPRSQWPHSNRYPKLEIADEQLKTFYISVTSIDALTIPINVWSKDDYRQRLENRGIGLGIYFGLIIVMAAYSFILFVKLGDRNYLWYVLYISCLGLMQYTYEGFAFLHALGDNPWLANRMLSVMTFTPMVFATQFIRAFLSIKANHRRLDRFIIALMGYLFLMIIFSLVAPDYQSTIKSASLTSLLFPIIVLSISFYQWRRGSTAAFYFLIALKIQTMRKLL